MKNQLRKHQENSIGFEGKIKNFEEQITVLKTENSQILINNDDLKRKLSELDADLSKFKNREVTFGKEIETIKQRFIDTSDSIVQLKKVNFQLVDQKSILENENQNFKETNEKLLNEIKDYEIRIIEFKRLLKQKSESRYVNYDFILEESQKKLEYYIERLNSVENENKRLKLQLSQTPSLDEIKFANKNNISFGGYSNKAKNRRSISIGEMITPVSSTHLKHTKSPAGSKPPKSTHKTSLSSKLLKEIQGILSVKSLSLLIPTIVDLAKNRQITNYTDESDLY